jgi:hypothetical protein
MKDRRSDLGLCCMEQHVGMLCQRRLVLYGLGKVLRAYTILGCIKANVEQDNGALNGQRQYP